MQKEIIEYLERIYENKKIMNWIDKIICVLAIILFSAAFFSKNYFMLYALAILPKLIVLVFEFKLIDKGWKYAKR